MGLSIEIRVQEKVQIYESLHDTQVFVLKLIQEWFESDDQMPLKIVLSKTTNRGPPSIKVKKI